MYYNPLTVFPQISFRASNWTFDNLSLLNSALNPNYVPLEGISRVFVRFHAV